MLQWKIDLPIYITLHVDLFDFKTDKIISQLSMFCFQGYVLKFR